MADPSSRYFDAAASWPLRDSARDAIAQVLGLDLGDSRAAHTPGRSARQIFQQCRAVGADALGVHPNELSFTPSGTHAVQVGLAGLVQGARLKAQLRLESAPRPIRLALSAIEHSSVQATAHWLANRGEVEIDELPVDSAGRVAPEAVAVSAAEVWAIQAANGEVGTFQDHSGFERRALFVDACAGAGLLELPTQADVVALSAHKWGGLPGTGLLVVRKSSDWRAPFPLDHRVDERAVGAENIVGIAAATSALVEQQREREAEVRRYQRFADVVREGLADVADVEWLGSPENRLPHLVAFSVLYLRAEELVHQLDRRGFAIASGSACLTQAMEPSHVLRAMGALSHGNVRLSFHHRTTLAEVQALTRNLRELIHELREDIP